MNRRVQLSLLFDDADLFEGLVVPWKANRELSPLVIKLLSAYFYSDEIRGLVDCFQEEEIVCEEATSSFEESIANARNTLAFMNMLTEGAKTVLSGGIDEINNIASATGGAPAQETKFGMGLPSFGNVAEFQGAAKEEVSPVSEVPSSVDFNTDKRLSDLEHQLSAILTTVSTLNETVLKLTSGVSNNVGSVEPTKTEPVEPIKVEASEHVETVLTEDVDNVSPTELSNTQPTEIVETSTSETDVNQVQGSTSESTTDDFDLFDEDDVVPAPPKGYTKTDINTPSEAELKATAELNDLVDSVVAESNGVSGSSSLEEVDALVETLVAESEVKKVEAVTSGTTETSEQAEIVENSSTETQKVEETPKPKDGSDSLRAFLSNGVGFSVEL